MTVRLVFALFLSAVFAAAQQPDAANRPPGGFASLQGHVGDASGHAVRKAGLTLRTAPQAGGSGDSIYRAATDADGNYSFERITPGSYTLSVERAGYLRKQYRANPHETFSAIPLAAGQHRNGINFVLARAAAISGRVLDEENDPVAGVAVRVLRQSYSSRRPAIQHFGYTDESGRYEIPGLSPGEYYLSAGMGAGRAFSILGMRVVGDSFPGPPAKPGEPPTYYEDTYYPNGTDEHGARAIQVLHADLEGMDIRLRKTRAFLVKGKVAGTVPGDSLEQCEILLTPANPPWEGPMPQGTAARIAKDGSFDFPRSRFPPGDYFITAMAPVDRRLILAPQRLVVGERDIDVVLNLQPLLEIRGSLVVEGEPHTAFNVFPGTPPPSVTMRVGLTPVNGPTLYNSGSAVTNDGAFTIAGVVQGAYEVRTSGMPAGTFVKSIQFGAQQVTRSEIEVTGASGGARLQIMLSRSVGRIEGIVETDQGKPAAGSTLILFSDPPGKVSMLTGAGENGEFNLSPVAPGKYRLYAWEDIDTAQRYDPALLKVYEGKSVTVTVGENGRERVKVVEIPASEPPE